MILPLKTKKPIWKVCINVCIALWVTCSVGKVLHNPTVFIISLDLYILSGGTATQVFFLPLQFSKVSDLLMIAKLVQRKKKNRLVSRQKFVPNPIDCTISLF